ncbi:MAG: redox-sensing transcriptional repressor Rex [Verrucomicrobia bacterium]|nr:redox-sensing transcriptional repressor Rex [Verrucomicrobiota bacterium]
MPKRRSIPRKAIYRLSVYLRCLERLKENAIKSVSSEALATAAGVAPPQLRKDLTYFGQFGTRGLGYDVETLARRIRDTLGTTHLQPAVLVGAGNLGAALMAYRGFAPAGFEILAGFDEVPRRRGQRPPQPVLPMNRLKDFVRARHIKIAIITVPAAAAQDVANQLIRAGITGILNFAPLVLHVPEHVTVNNVNVAIELENLSYFIKG